MLDRHHYLHFEAMNNLELVYLQQGRHTKAIEIHIVALTEFQNALRLQHSQVLAPLLGVPIQK